MRLIREDLSVHQRRSAVRRYGVMLTSVAIAYALTRLVPHLRDRESFLAFFAAITISAWYGGMGPGLWACGLSAVITNIFFYEPLYSISINEPAIVTLIFFVFIGIMISSLTSKLMRAEEIAREQRQWFEVLLASIGDSVIATDPLGKITYMNFAAEKLLSTPFDAIRGRDVHEVLDVAPRAGPSQAPSLIQQVLLGKAADGQSEPMSLSKGGEETAIEYSAASIKDARGNLMGVVLAIRDVTERESARTKILAYQEDLRLLATNLSMAGERERREIATGLHDRVGQTLALSNIKLGELRATLKDVAVIKCLDEIHLLLKQMMSEIRSLTFELSPPILYEFGLEPALEWLCEHFEHNHGVKCSFRKGGDTQALPQDVRVALYQAVRELLTNVVKHARASHVSVFVDKEDDNWVVTVEDDGKGFDATAVKPLPGLAQGFGLFSVRERIRHWGGCVTLKSAPGQGTRISLLVPAAN